MIWLILSLGALNALIPLLIIIILICAAGLTMRGYSFFNLFGLETLFSGLGTGGGRSSITNRPMTSHVYGPKSISLKQPKAKIQFGKVLNATAKKRFPGAASAMAKAATPPWKWKEMTTKRSRYYDPATARLAANKKFAQDAFAAVAAGTALPAVSNTLKTLNARYPDASALERAAEERATTMKMAGLVIDVDKARQTRGAVPLRMSYRDMLKSREVERRSSAEYAKTIGGATPGEIRRNRKVATLRERGLGSLQTVGLLGAAQAFQRQRQAEFEKKVAGPAHAKLVALEKSKGRMSERDYESQRAFIQRDFEKRAARFHDQVANSRVSPLQLASAGASVGRAMGYAIKGDHEKFEKHINEYWNKLAPGVKIAQGGRTFGSTNPNQLREAKPMEESEGANPNQMTEEQRLLQYKERKAAKKANKKDGEDKELGE